MDLKLRRRKEKIENERKEEGVRERERERVIEREKDRENNVREWRGDDCVKLVFFFTKIIIPTKIDDSERERELERVKSKR